ncbi:MAG: pyridoxal-phosphate dependent enzyme [Planctomycetota bacterium]
MTRIRLEAALPPTPLYRAERLSARLGRETWLKLEGEQPTGSFKVRPALAGVLALDDEARARGIVTSSSGNFAAAAAWAAGRAGTRATVVVMPSASPHKIDNARRHGAEIAFCEDDYAARQSLVDRLVAERGLAEIHPHDSDATLAGDATMAAEIAAQLPTAAAIIAPVSGGGLLGGLIEGAAAFGLEAAIWGAQAAGSRAFADSFAAGERLTGPAPMTEADGLTATRPGSRGFAAARAGAAGVVVVSEKGMLRALWALQAEEGIIAEPSSAVGLAALEEGLIAPGPGPIVLVLTGRNVDPVRHRRLVVAGG